MQHCIWEGQSKIGTRDTVLTNAPPPVPVCLFLDFVDTAGLPMPWLEVSRSFCYYNADGGRLSLAVTWFLPLCRVAGTSRAFRKTGCLTVR